MNMDVVIIAFSPDPVKNRSRKKQPSTADGEGIHDV